MSNNPPILVELDDALAEFVMENCDSNIEMSLVLLQRGADANMSQSSLEKFVALGENFKKLKKLVAQAKKERDDCFSLHQK